MSSVSDAVESRFPSLGTRKTLENPERESLLQRHAVDQQKSKAKPCSIEESRYRPPRTEESHDDDPFTKEASVPRTLTPKDRIEEPQVLAIELGRTKRILIQS